MKKFAMWMAAVAVMAVTAGQARASLVVNGSFEEYDGVLNGSGGYYQHVQNGTPVGGDGSVLEGWGVGVLVVDWAPDGGVDLVRDEGADADPLGPPADGEQFVDLNGTPGPGNIYQTLNTVAGQEYLLRFAYAYKGSPTPGTAGFGVWDTDTSGDAIVPVTLFDVDAVHPLDWDYKNVLFVAQSDQTLISFGQWEPFGGKQGIYIDDVSVSAIPEPATVVVWSFLGLCGVGLSYFRKRRLAA